MADAASVAKALGINLDNTLGAMFIGLIFSAVLFGVTVMQSVHYLTNFPRDPRYMKYIVSVLLLLDTLHTILVSHTMYTFLVTNFGDLLTIAETVWSIQLMTIVTVLSVCIVDFCFLHRVWILSEKNRLLTALPTLIVLVSTSTGIAVGVKCFEYSSLLQLSQISYLLYTSFGGAIVVDIWISASLCYFLAKSRSSFRDTNKKVSLLMTYIINTGALSGVCAVIILITYATMPHTYIFLALYEGYSKIFLNALLAMLNARGKLSGGTLPHSSAGSAPNPVVVFNSGAGAGAGGRRLQMRSTNPPPPSTGSFSDSAYDADIRKSSEKDADLLPSDTQSRFGLDPHLGAGGKRASVLHLRLPSVGLSLGSGLGLGMFGSGGGSGIGSGNSRSSFFERFGFGRDRRSMAPTGIEAGIGLNTLGLGVGPGGGEVPPVPPLPATIGDTDIKVGGEEVPTAPCASAFSLSTPASHKHVDTVSPTHKRKPLTGANPSPSPSPKIKTSTRTVSADDDTWDTSGASLAVHISVATETFRGHVPSFGYGHDDHADDDCYAQDAPSVPSLTAGTTSDGSALTTQLSRALRPLPDLPMPKKPSVAYPPRRTENLVPMAF